jgi:hypothetical protein
MNTTNLPLCGFAVDQAACGNGKLDDCVFLTLGGESVPGNCGTMEIKEVCDGDLFPNPPTCVSLGFFGGTVSCSHCSVEKSACLSCAAGSAVASCQDITAPGPIVVDASGQEIAIGGAIYRPAGEDLELVATTNLGAATWVGVTDGWLAFTYDANELAVRTVSLAGVVGTPRTIRSNDTSPVASYEPGGHVLLAWMEDANPGKRVVATIVDSSGAQVKAPAIVVDTADADDNLSVASDNASFFLLDATKLLRMTSAGDVVGTTSLATAAQNERRMITANTNARWLVDVNGASTSVRSVALDGTFADVEHAVLVTGSLAAFTPYANDLLAVLTTTSNLQLVHIDATGHVTTPFTIGIGTTPALALFGATAIATWTSQGTGNFATITP